MILTLQVLANYLEEFLQVSLFSDYCPNGIQVEGKSDIKKIGFAVSASLETIEKARDKNVDALIVHHGIFWNKDPYPLVTTKKKKIKALIENDISLLAYHLPLDANPTIGNNFKAFLDLNFTELNPFAQIGVKGSIEEIPIKEFIQRAERYFNHKATSALFGKKTIKSAALVSGGAHKTIEEAVKEGVDCFITGSFDEPVWHYAKENNINFLAFGHFATEVVGPLALKEHIEKLFKVECEFIDIYNPF
jgi:dinuclear metal center YbgI/SA1388 family protein